MQTKLEKRLSRLDAPTAPQNLQDRCLETILVPSTARSREIQRTARPFRANRLVIASAFLFVQVAGIAFLSTRPPSDGKTMGSGSVAFAQMLEAARGVTFVHAKGKQVSINIDQKGWYSSDWSCSEAWFDAEKGLYEEESGVEPPSPSLKLDRGTSSVSRMLLLPDGTRYSRSATSSTLQVKSNPEIWRKVQGRVATLLMGFEPTKTRAASPIGFNEQGAPQLLSSTESNWKGQEARLLVFEQQPSQENADRGAPVVQAHFYLNPKTNLVIARQDFAVPANDSPRLVAEYEMDYTRPNPKLFDPAPLEIGADTDTGEKTTP